ncbi:unnamed protein product [Mytilus edulis]|uniref:Uncharacterized protein n=1 Tax=Mytilus edulis TaxID=6550 RepID=A0A8S3SEK5_MYTED|nr:unnamed protein product [Mytilus edulis]
MDIKISDVNSFSICFTVIYTKEVFFLMNLVKTRNNIRTKISMEDIIDESVQTKSLLMKSVLDAAGFSPTEIKFKKNTHDFHDFVRKQLFKADDAIYVGSRAEGIAGGFYFSGDESDLDAILPFPETKVYETKQLRKLSKEEHPVCFAIHDKDFPGYMKIRWSRRVHRVYIGNEVIELKTGFLPNECVNKLVRKHLAEEFNITRDISITFEPSGPALTEIFLDNKSFCQVLSSDTVPCLVYDYWPPCANDWINRSKDTGWPSKETIEQVVAKNAY